MKKAVQWGLMGRNPTEAVSVPRAERTEMQTLSEDQVKELFAVTRGEALHGLWVLLATTGLRLGEALGLKWEDVDLAKGRLMVLRALQRQRGSGLVLVEPKTRKSRRTVYFPVGTGAALREHRSRQLELKLKLGPSWQDNDFVFCRDDGSAVDPSGLPEKLHRVLRKAGLPQIRVHDLRHTAATLHLARGENPKVVQELLGHSNISITMDTYSHVTPVMHQAAAAKMQSLFAEG
jgi:integrase